MKFRYHRGGFAESMATAVSFKDAADLERILGGPIIIDPIPDIRRDGIIEKGSVSMGGKVVGFIFEFMSQDTIPCTKCSHNFDESLGKYGCPNCCGEGIK